MDDLPETKNALWRREDQRRRWSLSETNKLPGEGKPQDQIRVKFQDGCVFLAACAAEDTEEVKRLLQKGADINTANVDGLTALHQACIDDTIDIVQFLVEQGADINAQDNEGWTPLHVSASCGTPATAKYLIDAGADIAAVNNDGELAYDLAEGDEMELLIEEEMHKQDIDADGARNEEQDIMMQDAEVWLKEGLTEVPHPKTGATALHVAAAKGYTEVMILLLQAGADMEARDHDGWTPLHAAAHWGQEAAATFLVESFCNMEAKNNAGQTAFDVCDTSLRQHLTQLRQKQASLNAERKLQNEEKTINRHGQIKRRSSVTRMSVDKKRDVGLSSVLDERDKVLEALSNKPLDEKKEDLELELEDSIKSGKDKAPSEDTRMEPETPPPPVPDSQPPPPPPSSSSQTLTKPGTKPPPEIGTKPPDIEIDAKDKQDLSKVDDKVSTKSDDKTTDDATKPTDADKSDEEEESSEEETSEEEGDESSEEEEETETEKQNEINNKKSESAGVPTSPPAASRPISPPAFQPPAHILEEEERAEREKRRLLQEDARRREKENQLLIEEAKEAARQEELRRKKIQEEQDRVQKRASTGGINRLLDEPRSKEARKDDRRTSDYEAFSKQPLSRTVSLPGHSPGKSSSAQKSGGLGLARQSSYRPLDCYDPTAWRRPGGRLTSRGYSATHAPGSPPIQRLLHPPVVDQRHAHSDSEEPMLDPSSRNRIYSSSTLGDSGSGQNSYIPSFRRRDQPSSTASYSARGVSALATGGATLSSTTSSSSSTGSSSSTTATAGAGRRSSFEPPKRDEEKEVERKARAKRARETRRSTQGVTKEDLVRAEESLKQANQDSVDDKDKENRPSDDDQLIMRPTDTKEQDDKRKNRDSGIGTDNNNYSYLRGNRPATTLSNTTDTASTMRSSTTTTSATSSTPLQSSLRSSHASNTRNTVADPTDTAAALATLLGTSKSAAAASPPGSSSASPPQILLHHDTDSSSISSKDEKEDPSQKSAAIKARRKREHRKLTGKVTLEELQKAQEEADDKLQQSSTTATTTSPTTASADTTNYQAAGSRYGTSSSSSRLSDPSGTGGGYTSGDYSRSSYLSSRSAERPSSYIPSSSSSSYNRSNTNLSVSSVGSDKDVDYKRLYESEKLANEKLRKDVDRLQQELKEAKVELERARLKVESKSHDSRTDLRERRAQERRISELEEEIKTIANLKADNNRLKEENGALIRVISKLSK